MGELLAMDEIDLGLGHETGLIWSRVWARRGLRRGVNANLILRLHASTTFLHTA